MSTVISVENLGKKYTITHQQREQYTDLRDTITNGFALLGKKLINPFRRTLNPQPSSLIRSSEDFWALKDVSIEVKQGDRIGIIGRNGAGKSTLLKILSRITEPTTGSVRIKGRVASLLEVGTGFHPELTGRENIFLNGAILGMGRAEIKKKFDEIVDFAEIDKFLDTSVKRYSSGMYVRLAFAVAAHLEPEILIVDEVLAVGDAQFQKKCLGKMEDVGREGRTVLFVSHNMGAVHTLTQKCIYLVNGEVHCYSDTARVVETYLANAFAGAEQESFNFDNYRPDYVIKGLTSDKKIIFSNVWVEQGQKKATVLLMGEPISVVFELEACTPIEGANLSFSIVNSQNQLVTVIFSLDREFSVNIRSGKHLIQLDIDDLMLTPGKYYVSAGINQTTDTVAWDVLSGIPLFEIKNSGKVVHWLHRPWGTVQSDNVHWKLVS